MLLHEGGEFPGPLPEDAVARALDQLEPGVGNLGREQLRVARVDDLVGRAGGRDDRAAVRVTDEQDRAVEVVDDTPENLIALDALLRSHGVGTSRDVEEIVARGRRAVEWSRYYEEARVLARMLTEWSLGLETTHHRFVVTSGGGPGIMEAANRGAVDAGGKTIGLNISLPHEQGPNPYITDDLHFEFHYFFMRKFWFAYLAKALVIFPGGFGTLAEMFEILTLMQTEKLAKQIQILLYGSEYWDPILNMKPLVEWGAIAERDVDLLMRADTPEAAFELLKEHLTKHHLHPPVVQEKKVPGIAKTRSGAGA